MNNLSRKVPTYPVMELPMIAFVLAIAAGSMDGYTFFIGKAFSTVQSGNMILLGQTIATQNWSHFGTVLITICCFGIGSMATALIENFGVNIKKIWSFEILIFEAIVLILLSLSSINSMLSVMTICMVISFIAGMQGNAFHKIDGMLYGNIAVTMVVQLAFSYFIQIFMKKKDAGKNSFLYFLVLFGFSGGGLIGTLLAKSVGEKSLLFSAFCLLLLAFYSKIINVEEYVMVDPD